MAEKINLNKTNLGRTSYINTINTQFTQLLPPTPVTADANLPTVSEFFDDYNSLFFTIPKTGDNSHTSLIESSAEYIGYVPQSLEIEALQQEITFLREQILDLRGQLNQTTNNAITDANNALSTVNTNI